MDAGKGWLLVGLADAEEERKGYEGGCALLSSAGELTCGESCTWSSWCEGYSCNPGLGSPRGQRRLVPLALDQEEKQERNCDGCSPRQSQGSGLPACGNQGGLSN